MQLKALLIEDDAAFRKAVSKSLALHGYTVLEAASGKAGIAKALREQPDIIILDLVMPGMHGLEACAKLKTAMGTAGIPVLILTGNDQEGQDIACLDLGADDYLAKPVKTERLLAYCRALLRRSGRRSDAGRVRLGTLELDYRRKLAIFEGKEYPHLTPKEFGVLYELALNSPEPRDRESLYRKLWEAEPPSATSLRTIEVHVRRIRMKLGWPQDSWLLGVHGRGYCLIPPRAGRLE